ncbi:ATP-binding cassette domain-containing protein [Streptomyces qinzhouensis]|uniref:ABC transporter ATP-binding protein n=1 Tax=Streptomyces qinzhouensis TaxID=2599401 RepID=A0A5B8J5H9_9ACTN|nr:ABC transporter ATP-binding protein [Streptomyces qinzhouensis]QDY75291.1 ABC transporter ATP-binding protein [Streptomyces qinzhouensis]
MTRAPAPVSALSDGAGPRRERAALRRVAAEGLPFLRARARVLRGLLGWSLLEFAQTFAGGYAVARALDDGFLAGETATGMLWLALAAVAVVPAFLAQRGVFAGLADLVEPLRDGLVRRATAHALTTEAGNPAAGTGAVSRVTHQSEIARDGWAGLVLALRGFVFTSAGALAGLAALSPLLLVVVLPPLLLGIGLFLATLVPMGARQRDYLDADEAFAAHTGRATAALRDIAATGAAGPMAERTRELAEAQTVAARSLARWSALRITALAIGERLPPVLLLAAAPRLMDHGLTTGGLIGAFTYLTTSLAPALNALLAALGTAGGRLLVVLDRFTERAELPPAPAAHASGNTGGGAGGGTPAPAARAELRQVSFAYGPRARPVLDRLDLRLLPGDHLAVVGPSGSGKSTLVAVLAGLARPTAGEVRWLGRPAAGQEPTAVRTLLPQQPYVFTGTLRDNLRYLRPGAPDGDLMAAVTAIGLDALAERLGGLDAPLDPRRLSQGERQLIALGRAHVATAPLLVLDEATSHLDPAAEARAETALAARADTLVVVAHRLSSARRAARVLVMDGTRTEEGTPDELLTRSALFRELTGSWAPPPLVEPAAARATRSGQGLPSGSG